MSSPTTDSILDKYTRQSTPSREPAPPASELPGGEQEDDYGAFGWLHGVRDRAIMIELRKKDGSRRAYGNAWLSHAEFDPSVGITLHISGQKIVISGRNLNAEIRPNVRLFAGIVRHRIPFIQEADECDLMKAKEGDTVIQRITW